MKGLTLILVIETISKEDEKLPKIISITKISVKLYSALQ
jgi:hypothetical protein